MWRISPQYILELDTHFAPLSVVEVLVRELSSSNSGRRCHIACVSAWVKHGPPGTPVRFHFVERTVACSHRQTLDPYNQLRGIAMAEYVLLHLLHITTAVHRTEQRGVQDLW